MGCIVGNPQWDARGTAVFCISARGQAPEKGRQETRLLKAVRRKPREMAWQQESKGQSPGAAKSS